nr:GUN4 domain-containing protein [Prochlorococcus marinus]
MPSDKSDSTNLTIHELLEKFSSGSLRQKRRFVKLVEERSSDFKELGEDLLKNFDPESDNWCAGWLLQVCQRHQPQLISKLIDPDSSGWFRTHSGSGVNYAALQQALLEERFEDADRMTSSTLRELAGPSAVERGYVYFSEVTSITEVDLITLDRLWIAYSQGKFGFSVQARLLEALKGRYEMLWPKIGWKENGVWTRYPNAFTWSISAPEGHMPLINQLRGVRLMDALINHSAFNPRRSIKT